MSKAADPIEGYYAQQTPPTARELLDVMAHTIDFLTVGTLAARVERVLALHQPDRRDECNACAEGWPCPTRRILDGLEG
jgi:hypothetical protein